MLQAILASHAGARQVRLHRARLPWQAWLGQPGVEDEQRARDLCRLAGILSRTPLPLSSTRRPLRFRLTLPQSPLSLFFFLACANAQACVSDATPIAKSPIFFFTVLSVALRALHW